MDQTFSIIKPDATKRNLTGSINSLIENNGLRIIAQKRIKLTIEQAQKFYDVHKDKPFFSDLIEYMTSELAQWSTLFFFVQLFLNHYFLLNY